jgi:Na+-translocating ferredoxin:NAD+ oxidoreductase subunit G
MMGLIQRWRSQLWYQASLLGVVVLITSTLLALFTTLTAEDIAAARRADLQRSLQQVLPINYDNDLLEDTLTFTYQGATMTVYRAREAGVVVAVVFSVIGKGYAGPIESVMALDRDGMILGVRVLSHRETPGLGDKIERAKGEWIDSFSGRSLANTADDGWAVKRDGGLFDQFTGATITPRAVIESVHGGVKFFALEQQRLLDPNR